MSRRCRHPVHGATCAPAAATMRIRTRIRYTGADLVVLVALGRHFERLSGKDLAARCRAGASHDKVAWAARKRAVTEHCSSRWAGRVTKASSDTYATARRNQLRHLAEVERAIAAIGARLARPVHSGADRKELVRAEAQRARAEGRRPRRLSFGYRSAHEHAMKRRRLEALRTEQKRVGADIASGRVHVTLGGRRLLRTRLHLDDAQMTEEEWRARWSAARWSFGANGEAGKRFGNETIRVDPSGTVEVDLPGPLAGLANVTTRRTTRYRFDARVAFSYRAEEWRAQVETNRAVAYDIVFGAKGAVYLDASFTTPDPVEVSSLGELGKDPGLRVLALDLNHGFVAPAVLDRSGNMVGHLDHVRLFTEDLCAATRDGHLRQAVTSLLDLAEDHRCRLVVCEDLGFCDMRATGRERYGSKRWFRRVVCGIPTRQFRDRLVAMAARRGIAVAGVPAAYSSLWGAEHWQGPLSSKKRKVSRHTAAAVVLGRRALGHSARRRPKASPGVTAPDRRIEEPEVPEGTHSTGGAESYHMGRPGSPGARHDAPRRPPRRQGHPARGRKTRTADSEPRGARPAKTVRAGPSTSVGRAGSR